MNPTEREDLECTLAQARDAAAKMVVLDYDGTLVSFAPTPELAAPDRELCRMLAALASSRETAVHIVSGRPRESLECWFGDLAIGLHAEHGYWSRAKGGDWRPNVVAALQWQAPLRVLLEEVARRTPGAMVEVKHSSLAFHYRLVDGALAAQRIPELRRMLGPCLASQPIELLTGAGVLEVRPRGVHKGLVVRELCRVAAAGTVTLVAGDDVTDEDAFRVLPQGSIAIKVGSGPSMAPFQVSGPSELRRLLWSLV